MTVTIGATAAIATIAAIALSARIASARPVRIGRYAEIPYGVRTDHPCPTESCDARRNGRSRAAVSRTAPAKVWQTRLHGAGLTTPIITADGSLYVGWYRGLAKLTSGGALVWDEPLGAVQGAPSVTPYGDIVVTTRDGALVAVSEEGDVRVRRETSAVYGSTLVLPDGAIIVGAHDHSLRGFDSELRELFRTPTDDVPTTPAWSQLGRIVVATGGVVDFVALDGSVRAIGSLGAPAATGPAIADDGTVWIATLDATIFALEEDGRVRSRAQIGERTGIFAPLAIGRDGGARAATRASILVCVGPSGTERWRVTIDDTFQTGVVLDRNDAALALTSRGQMYAIGRGGAVLWHIDIEDRSDVTPAVGADGTIYVATRRGVVQAWR